MKNLLTRTVTGLLFAVVMVGSIIYAIEAFGLLMLFFVIIGSHEVSLLFKKDVISRKDRVLFVLPAIASYGILLLTALQILDYKHLILNIILLLFPFLHALFSKRHLFFEVVTIHWVALFFVALPSGLMLLFFSEDLMGPMAGPHILLTVIAFIWINDIFAYLVGVRFGKHRLFERVSPKKSWEGSFGGLIFTLLAALLLAKNVAWIGIADSLMIALIVVITGSLGDLIESKIKREAGVKDSGKLMPGHGGVLDRFDAAFFAIPFVFVYLLMI